MDGLDRSVWNQLTCKFIWGQDKDRTRMILKEKEKAGALPAGRRWEASGGGKNRACFFGASSGLTDGGKGGKRAWKIGGMNGLVIGIAV